MSGAARSGLTLLTLVLLVVVGGAWGWSALTKPFPQEEVLPICTDTLIPAGTDISRDEIVVDVYNGSNRTGLAGSTQDLLVERGFVAGSTGNAPDQVQRTQIWTRTPKNPDVLLVKRQFKGARIIDQDPLGEGVTVVVAAGFDGLRKKQVEMLLAKTDVTICQATGAD